MTIGKKTRGILKRDFVRAKRRVTLTTGDMLRILREKNELTQSELASLTGLTQATVSSLEKGGARLGVERSKTLARVLHVHPAVLLFPDWEMEEAA
jgi:transcriptional regulator with XRE-family HTH domain